MRKRQLSALLALCMALALLPAAFAADSASAGYSDSGSTAMTKLTKLEIARLVEMTKLSDPTQIYSAAPGISAPYSPGSLREDVLLAGLNRLNALRSIAGLPAVTLDAACSESAQAAALTNAVNNTLSHYPTQPSGMSDALYRQGASGASSSNISFYYGYRPADGPIAFSVDMWMDDSDAYNVDRLGHRRWQLNPTMSKTGFGAVYSSSGGLYAAEYAHDRSGSGADYTFIAWPSSGNFPAIDRLFHADTAWSVTLNPNKYQTPSRSSVAVTLTRQSDGRSWTFSGNESYTVSGSGKYFNVETGGYGVSNCIIFRPDGVGSYEGVYTVTITGLQSRSGAAETLSYQVDFFDPDDIDTTPAEPEAPSFTDVPRDSWCFNAVSWAVEKGVTNGYGDSFGPDDTCTNIQILTLLYRAVRGEGAASGDDMEKAVSWARERNMINDSFVRDDYCTRSSAVMYIWQALGSPSPAKNSSFTDVPAGEPYADAVSWAVEKGVTNGYTADFFGPDDTCTRGQIVTFLYRAYGSGTG